MVGSLDTLFDAAPRPGDAAEALAAAARERILIPLDVDTADAAVRLVKLLRGHVGALWHTSHSSSSFGHRTSEDSLARQFK